MEFDYFAVRVFVAQELSVPVFDSLGTWLRKALLFEDTLVPIHMELGRELNNWGPVFWSFGIISFDLRLILFWGGLYNTY